MTVKEPAADDSGVDGNGTASRIKGYADSVNYEPTFDEKQLAMEVVSQLSEEEIANMTDVHMPLRNVRARDLDASKALKAVKYTLKFRDDFNMDEYATCQEDGGGTEEGKEGLGSIIRRENATGKLYVRGHDGEGRAILYMRPGKENTVSARVRGSVSRGVFPTILRRLRSLGDGPFLFLCSITRKTT